MKEYTIERFNKEYSKYREFNPWLDDSPAYKMFIATTLVNLTNKNIELEERVKELEK